MTSAKSSDLDPVATVQTDTLCLHCDVCPHRIDEKISDFRARTGLPGDALKQPLRRAKGALLAEAL